jgi:hypothetical protein
VIFTSSQNTQNRGQENNYLTKTITSGSPRVDCSAIFNIINTTDRDADATATNIFQAMMVIPLVQTAKCMAFGFSVF